MTDDDLRDELESLKERVSRLERLLDERDVSLTATNSDAVDHRDEAVLAALEQRASEPSKRALVKMYQRHTDIVNSDTAKQRAQALHGTDAYTAAVENDE